MQMRRESVSETAGARKHARQENVLALHNYLRKADGDVTLEAHDFMNESLPVGQPRRRQRDFKGENAVQQSSGVLCERTRADREEQGEIGAFSRLVFCIHALK